METRPFQFTGRIRSFRGDETEHEAMLGGTCFRMSGRAEARPFASELNYPPALAMR